MVELQAVLATLQRIKTLGAKPRLQLLQVRLHRNHLRQIQRLLVRLHDLIDQYLELYERLMGPRCPFKAKAIVSALAQ